MSFTNKPQEFLVPCPFCGQQESLEIKSKTTGSDETFFGLFENTKETKYYVLCLTRKGGCGASTGRYTSVKDAIKAWNSRSDSSSSKFNTTKDNLDTETPIQDGFKLLLNAPNFDKIDDYLDEIGLVKDTEKRLRYLYVIMGVTRIFGDSDGLEERYALAKELLSSRDWRR